MSVYTTRPTVGTAAVLLGPTHPSFGDYKRGCSVMVYNPGPLDVVIGNASVTATTGLTLPSGSTLNSDLGDGELLYGILATGSQTVQTLETGV